MFNFKDFRSGTAPTQTTQSQRRRNDDSENKVIPGTRAKSRNGADLSTLNSEIKLSRQLNTQNDNNVKNNNNTSSSFSFFGNNRREVETNRNIIPLKNTLKSSAISNEDQSNGKQESRRSKTNQIPPSPKQKPQPQNVL